MSNLTIIAISGHKGAGKTALAQAICYASPAFQRVSLAHPLKQDIAAAEGITIEQLNACKQEYRRTMQIYGAIMRGKFGLDYWLRQLQDEITMRGYTHVVVDDLRYVNELHYLRAMTPNFYAVRINTPLLGAVAYAHASEMELDKMVGWHVVFDIDPLSEQRPSRAAMALQVLRTIGDAPIISPASGT